MQKIKFDSGIVSYRLGDQGVLRFNPSDPNLYSRFLEAMEQLREIEKELAGKAAAMTADAAGIMGLFTELDKQMKQKLNWVFGPGNDFDAILNGVNLLAVVGNGERVVTSLLKALEPVLVSGAKRCAREQADNALAARQARKEA